MLKFTFGFFTAASLVVAFLAGAIVQEGPQDKKTENKIPNQRVPSDKT